MKPLPMPAADGVQKRSSPSFAATASRGPKVTSRLETPAMKRSRVNPLKTPFATRRYAEILFPSYAAMSALSGRHLRDVLTRRKGLDCQIRFAGMLGF